MKIEFQPQGNIFWPRNLQLLFSVIRKDTNGKRLSQYD